jgi:hypothetical protein
VIQALDAQVVSPEITRVDYLFKDIAPIEITSQLIARAAAAAPSQPTSPFLSV